MRHSEVSDYFLQIRDILTQKQGASTPQPLYVNHNLKRDSESSVIEITKYPESFEGIIMSYADRF